MAKTKRSFTNEIKREASWSSNTAQLMNGIFAIVLALVGFSAYAQAPAPHAPTENLSEDAETVLGAVNAMKVYVEGCFSRGMQVPAAQRPTFALRMKAMERLEIEMHHYLVASFVARDRLTPPLAAGKVQEIIVGARREMLATTSPDEWSRTCKILSDRFVSKGGDFDFMYSRLLANLRAER